MLTREEDVDTHALRRQGWAISAIARYLGRDCKTVPAYLNGERSEAKGSVVVFKNRPHRSPARLAPRAAAGSECRMTRPRPSAADRERPQPS